MAKPESLFWQQVKKNLKGFSFVRLESWVNHGIPDVLGTSQEGIYFTIELKVTNSNKVIFSPHQIAYHETRKNAPAFILVKGLAQQGLSLSPLCISDPINWSFVQEQLALLIRGRTKD